MNQEDDNAQTAFQKYHRAIRLKLLAAFRRSVEAHRSVPDVAIHTGRSEGDGEVGSKEREEKPRT
jgi:hypothetical protein